MEQRGVAVYTGGWSRPVETTGPEPEPADGLDLMVEMDRRFEASGGHSGPNRDLKAQRRFRQAPL